jgi:hypothetical protein
MHSIGHVVGTATGAQLSTSSQFKATQPISPHSAGQASRAGGHHTNNVSHKVNSPPSPARPKKHQLARRMANSSSLSSLGYYEHNTALRPVPRVSTRESTFSQLDSLDTTHGSEREWPWNTPFRDNSTWGKLTQSQGGMAIPGNVHEMEPV